MLNGLRNYIRNNAELMERLISQGEIAGLVMCVAGIFMMTQQISYASIFLIIGIGLLAVVYLVHGNFLKEIFSLNRSGWMPLMLQACYVMLTVTTLGTLFKLQRWPGGTLMLMTGCTLTGVFFLFFLFKLYFSSTEDAQVKLLISNLIVRMLPTLLIAGFLLTIALNG